MITELHIYPDLSSSRPGLYQVFAGYKTIERYAVSPAQILEIVREIRSGRWWSLAPRVKIIRH